MSDHSFSGRFRINSVSSTDLMPICKGSTTHFSDIVKENIFDSLNNNTVDTQRHLFSNVNTSKLLHGDSVPTHQLDGLFENSCSNLSTPTSVDLVLPREPAEDLYSLHSKPPVSVDLHLKTPSNQEKHSEDALVTSRKLGKKTEEIVDTGPNGRFLKFSKEIGRGAFKTVYKGIDTETGVAIAWCEINNRRCTRDETVRFKREVEILKKLQHPNILRFYDFFSCANRRGFVLITELMNAGTLRTFHENSNVSGFQTKRIFYHLSYLSRFTSIPLRLIKNWCLQILRGLQFLHSRDPSIIHRDLKCDNIFINGANGSVKIGDLGLAVLSNSNARTVIGTPEFMAPEMYEEDYDEAVDIWAFGLCVLEMYTLEYPYRECRSPAAIFKRVCDGIRPKALDLVKDQDLYSIIVSCTEKDKNDRVTIPTLLNHELFQEQEIHMEEVPPIGTDTADPDNIKLVLSREQKAITLDFNLKIDNPERVVDELVIAGFVKHSEYAIFVKSLKNRIDKAKRNKYIPVSPNKHGDGTELANHSIPVEILGSISDCSETRNFPQQSFEFSNENFQDIDSRSRMKRLGSCVDDQEVSATTISESYCDVIQPSNRKVRLTLSGINGDKLVCFLISSNSTLEFGFSLQEYSSNELVKNMIDNKFILASEKSQFISQAELLTKLVLKKKSEKMDDSDIVEYINSLPNFEDSKYCTEEFHNQSSSPHLPNSEDTSFKYERNPLYTSLSINSQTLNHSLQMHKDHNNPLQQFSSGQVTQKISGCVPTGNFDVRTISSTVPSPENNASSQMSPTLPFFGDYDCSTQFHKFFHPNNSAFQRTPTVGNKVKHFNEFIDNERSCDPVVPLPNTYSRDPQHVKVVSDSRHCSPRIVNFELNNRLSKISNLDRGSKDKSYENSFTPAGFHIPSNLTTPNLCKSTCAKTSIIDSHMSDVLLLALFKGFKTPEFSKYMCFLEERLLTRTKVGNNSSSQNGTECFSCDNRSKEINSYETMTVVNELLAVHKSDFIGIPMNGNIPFSNDVVPLQNHDFPEFCSSQQLPPLQLMIQNIPSGNTFIKLVDPPHRHCATPLEYPTSPCKYVTLKESIIPLTEHAKESKSSIDDASSTKFQLTRVSPTPFVDSKLHYTNKDLTQISDPIHTIRYSTGSDI